MSSPDRENWWVEPALALFCVVAAIAAVIWVGYWILFGILWVIPYVVFTVIPGAVFTALMGFGLIFLCWVEFEGEEKKEITSYYGDISNREALTQWERDREFDRKKASLSPRMFHTRRLAFLFPILVALTYATFDLPEEHAVVVDKVVVQAEKRELVGSDPNELDGNGEPTPIYRKRPAVTKDVPRTVLQWPWLIDTFNGFNGFWQDQFSFLKQNKPYEPVLFDRNYWSVVAWLSLLLSGPILFWQLSEKRIDEEDRLRVLGLDEAVQAERDFWEGREASWKKEKEALQQSVEKTLRGWEARGKEVQILTAKLQFTPEGQQAKAQEVSQKRGVLDSDLL